MSEEFTPEYVYVSLLCHIYSTTHWIQEVSLISIWLYLCCTFIQITCSTTCVDFWKKATEELSYKHHLLHMTFKGKLKVNQMYSVLRTFTALYTSYMILKSIFWHTGSQCSDKNNTLNQNWDKHTEHILCRRQWGRVFVWEDCGSPQLSAPGCSRPGETSSDHQHSADTSAMFDPPRKVQVKDTHTFPSGSCGGSSCSSGYSSFQPSITCKMREKSSGSFTSLCAGFCVYLWRL